MKKLLLGLAISMFAMTGYGQVVSMTGANNLATDTVINAATKNLTVKVKGNGSFATVLTVTKISGTVGGTATLQGSLDGVNFADLATAYTITDGSQTKSYDFDRSKYVWYRFKVVGTGTMSASISAKVLSKL